MASARKVIENLAILVGYIPPNSDLPKRPLGFLGRHTPALEVVELVIVDRADRGSVRALHVVGLDLEVRDRVLTRPARRWSLAPVPNRWQPSADARCAILRLLETVPSPPARRASIHHDYSRQVLGHEGTLFAVVLR